MCEGDGVSTGEGVSADSSHAGQSHAGSFDIRVEMIVVDTISFDAILSGPFSILDRVWFDVFEIDGLRY